MAAIQRVKDLALVLSMISLILLSAHVVISHAPAFIPSPQRDYCGLPGIQGLDDPCTVPSPGTRGQGDPYLIVWADREIADTHSVFWIYVRSKVISINETGNISLAPNNNSVNVTLLDMDENLRISTFVLPLANGSAETPITVEPLWTTSNVNITVTDQITGLQGSTRIRTVMSDDYLVWSIRNHYFDSFGGFYESVLQEKDAAIGTDRAFTVAFSVTFALMVLLIFLRADQRRCHRVGAPSLWDRFLNRYWPYSFVPDDSWWWLDASPSSITNDRETAAQFERGRIGGDLRRLTEQQREIERHKLQVIKLMIDSGLATKAQGEVLLTGGETVGK